MFEGGSKVYWFPSDSTEMNDPAKLNLYLNNKSVPVIGAEANYRVVCHDSKE